MSAEAETESQFHVFCNSLNLENHNYEDDSSYIKQGENFSRFWGFLAKDFKQRRISETSDLRILQIIRLHQQYLIDPKWRLTSKAEKESQLSRLISARTNVRNLCRMNVQQEFDHLEQLWHDPWTGSGMFEILDGHKNLPLTDYFLGESFSVCRERLRILVDVMNVPKIAANLSSFIANFVFAAESERQSIPAVQRWREDVLQRHGFHDLLKLLDLHLGLLFKLSPDVRQIPIMLKQLNVSDLVAILNVFSQRAKQLKSNPAAAATVADGSIAQKIWTAKRCQRAYQTLLDFLTTMAAKQKLELSQLSAIVTIWLDQYDNPKDSEIDLDIDKFLSISSGTGFVTEIALQLHKKFGDSIRVLSIETFVRALNRDINLLEVARGKNDEVVFKATEAVIAEGLIRLTEVLQENLTLRREAILTAFTLTPTEALFRRVTSVAEESGFVDAGIRDADSVKKINDTDTTNGESSQDEVFHQELFDFKKMEFNEVTDHLMSSLSKGYGKGQSRLRARASGVEKKTRNLEALVTVQGDLITEAANYDPVRQPLTTVTSGTLRLPQRLVQDLLIVVEAPRWHLLSWVMDWTTLEEHCLNLMKNPEIKHAARELKHLVIDYTQFDAWSSDDEFLPTGIEAGYEHWENLDTSEGDERVVERGLNDDEDIEFNVVQPVTFKTDLDDDVLRNDNFKPIGNAAAATNHFLAATEEAKAVRSDLAGSQAPESLLRQEEVRQVLRQAVPGLDGDVEHVHPSGSVKMDVSVVYQMTRHKQDLDPRSPYVRARLMELVPGLSDYSYAAPTSPVHLDVGVVHVTLANSASSSMSQQQPSTSSTNVMLSNSQPRKIVLEPASMSTHQQMSTVESSTSNSSMSTLPMKTEATKIQYVYKHGTQTIMVDRPLTEDELSKLKMSLPMAANRMVSAAAHQQTSTTLQQSKQAVIVSRASIVSLPSQPIASTARLVLPAATSTVSVDTLANTLISQIQTPVQMTPSGQPIKVEDSKPSPGILPKFQFAFGREPNSAPTVIKTEPGLVVVKSEPNFDSPQTSTTTISMSPQKGTIIQSPKVGGGQVMIPVSGVTSLQSIVSSSPILASQLTLQATASPAAASHADLIRQLNLMRAQGLVVLQQWGDKQVLVHKATGRWIMRQGNRLVTVPPQALGINTADQAQEAASPPAIVMSSSTMEQLREFDSILESKFKTSATPEPPHCLPTSGSNNITPTSTPTKQMIVTSSSSSSPATFVIIAPQQQTSSSSGILSNNPVITSASEMMLGGSPLKVSSISAPTSPAKPVKIHSSSVSASASPLGVSSSALGFAKPSPKPQEDPDTLKRIQQILDDYNEQIRNSPDLQNRPAPRRRTNGPNVVTSNGTGGVEVAGNVTVGGSVGAVKRKQRLSSLSPPPSNGSSGCGESDLGSPSVVQISPANITESGMTTVPMSGLKVIQKSEASEDSHSSSPGYSVIRQIVVPPNLAASLQASGRQLMVVTGPGGKKMVALKPLYMTSSSTSTTVSPAVNVVSIASSTLLNKLVTVGSAGSAIPGRLISVAAPTTSMSSSASATSSSASSPDSSVISSSSAYRTALPVSIGSTAMTSLGSGPATTTIIRQPMTSMASTSIILSSTTSSSTVASSSMRSLRQDASPMLTLQNANVHDDRPSTPGLGIPMEMTPGQIMEAEICAANLLDDNPESPFALLSSASSGASLQHHHRRHKHDDEESLSETLPENLFTHDFHATSSDEDDDDGGSSTGDLCVSTTTSSASQQRKRKLSSSSEELSQQLYQQQQQKRTRIEHPPTRVRNLSQQKSVAGNATSSIGICVNESSPFSN